MDFSPRIVGLEWDGTNAQDILDMIVGYYAYQPGSLIFLNTQQLAAQGLPPSALIITPAPDSDLATYVYAYNHGDTVVCAPWQGAAALTATELALRYVAAP